MSVWNVALPRASCYFAVHCAVEVCWWHFFYCTYTNSVPMDSHNSHSRFAKLFPIFAVSSTLFNLMVLHALLSLAVTVLHAFYFYFFAVEIWYGIWSMIFFSLLENEFPFCCNAWSNYKYAFVNNIDHCFPLRCVYKWLVTIILLLIFHCRRRSQFSFWFYFHFLPYFLFFSSYHLASNLCTFKFLSKKKPLL